ncbi:MAG: pseudouridylate synthase [Prevotella sp.]|nr:pseudouridylate synthase [Prevotella sp.]
MDIQKTRELLPQQSPFIMIDCLTKFDEKITETSFEVRNDNIFVENGKLNACALAENIAQTCAARLGYVNKYILKKDVQIGFIGAIKNLSVVETPSVGDILTTRIEVLQDIMGVTLVDAQIVCNNKVIVKAQMKIAIAEKNM